MMKRVLTTLTLLLGLGGQALADEPVVLELDAPTDVNIGASYTTEISVQLPAGDYRQLALTVLFPSSGTSVQGTASPTTQEFDNAVPVTGGRRWSQQDTLDLTSGAAVRKFSITLSTTVRALRDLTTHNIQVSITGERSDTVGGPYAPITSSPASTLVILHGTPNLVWQQFGFGQGSGAFVYGGAPGILRRFVFLPQSTGTALVDAPTTWHATWGAGYTFVRSFGAGWSSTFVPDPDNPSPNMVIDSAPVAGTIGAGFVDAHTITANVGAALWVDLFIPCSSYGKTQAESDAQGDAYQGNAVVHAAATDASGNNVATFDLTHAPTAAIDLTNTCGSGGSFAKSEDAIGEGGTGVRWLMTVAPPFGVSEVHDAMVVDPLPSGTVGIRRYGDNGTAGDFETWSCNFGATPGYFTASEFLARRATDCRLGIAGYALGDTHVVYYAATWSGGDEGLRSASFYLMTYQDEAWVRAHPGDRLVNTAYFNGDLEDFPDLGDVAVEVTNEDPFEATATSDPIPSVGTVLVQMSRNGNPAATVSPLIDANGGAARVYAHASHAFSSGLFTHDPTISMSWPDGVIIDSVTPLTSSGCVGPLVNPQSPTAPFTSSPLEFASTDGSSPFTLGPDNCTVVARIDFHVDPNYPWIHGQTIPFSAHVESADAAPGNITLNYVAQVTTGMDVLLEGGCWTAPVMNHMPPSGGSQIFRAIAVNRGSDDLDGLELRFIVPDEGSYATAFAGPDLPSGAVIEVSRDGGSTWSAAPSGADANVTDVRVTGLAIEGAGLAAARPSFFVGITPHTPTSLVVGGAWVATEAFQLGQTPTRELELDASDCRAACDCPDPTPNDLCSGSQCNGEGQCVPTTVTCDSGDECTNVACDPETGTCMERDLFDCGKETPFYLPAMKGDEVIGAIRCVVQHAPDGDHLKCDLDGQGYLRVFERFGCE